MDKGWLSIGLCNLLTLIILGQVVHGLEHQTGLNSIEALHRAEQSLSTLCTEQGLPAKGMTLQEATAPQSQHESWRFDFRSPSTEKLLSIEVDEQGHVFATSARRG